MAFESGVSCGEVETLAEDLTSQQLTPNPIPNN